MDNAPADIECAATLDLMKIQAQVNFEWTHEHSQIFRLGYSLGANHAYSDVKRLLEKKA